MPSSARLIAALALLLCSSFVSDAHAKGAGDIQKMGIKSFDNVFSHADEIDDRLDRAQSRRKSGRTQVASALNLSADTSFSKSLQELKKRGQGKVKLAMKGSTPALSASDALPNNVRSAVTAVNSAVEDYTSLVKDLAGLPEEARALSREAKAFPKQFKKEFGSALSLESLLNLKTRINQAKKLKNNLQITASLPETANKLLQGLRADIQDVSQIFSGR